MTEKQTLFDKIWSRHLVPGVSGEGLPSLLYVDLHLVHEVTSPQAFSELDRRGLKVRRPAQTLATMDHSTPTLPGTTRSDLRVLDPQGARQLDRLTENCSRHGIPLFDLESNEQGIIHVIAPEQGLTQPGMTVVCGDSHTSTHGAFGALAFGIGTSEVGHVLATQCLFQHKPRNFEVRIEGSLSEGVTAKDLILFIIARLGVDRGTGSVYEYRGEAIRALDMESRMTVCNMSIEGGARAGLIAPDQTTFDYIEGRPLAPRGEDWSRAVADWRALETDEGASFDESVVLDGDKIEPMVTYGTNPGMAVAITGTVPTLDSLDPRTVASFEKALSYMALEPGEALLGRKVDVVFLGSCTNSRISDLRAAARILDGKRVAPGVRMLVVPGSKKVKEQAEEECLDEVFLAAGAEWREAGCSMCLAMNGDQLEPGQYAVSTSNRNFEGRQGAGGRTFLASPLTAAASAIEGQIADVRERL